MPVPGGPMRGRREPLQKRRTRGQRERPPRDQLNGCHGPSVPESDDTTSWVRHAADPAVTRSWWRRRLQADQQRVRELGKELVGGGGTAGVVGVGEEVVPGARGAGERGGDARAASE